MHHAIVKGIALARLAAFMFAVLSVGSCGGGGGGGDSSGSKLFVADSGNDAIGSVVNTNPPPGNIIIDRVITGTSSNFISGTIPALFLDAARDQLYVSNEVAIFVFHNAGIADGPIDFNRRVAMLPAGGNFNSLQLDSTRDMLYVGDQPNGVRVYHNASTLNETGGPDNLPDRTIVPASLATPTSFVRDIAVDATKDILYVAVVTTGASPSMSIFAFDNASIRNGSLTPDRTITIATSTYGTMGLFIDSANDRLYFADSGGGVSIFETASTKNDPVTPDKSVLLLSTILRLTVDTVNDRLYAAGSTALYIVPNISTVPPGPATATAALAAPGSSFTAVAVRP